MRFSSSDSILRPHNVFGTTPKNAPPSHQWIEWRMSETSKSPSGSVVTAAASTSHELAAAVKQVDRVFHELAAAIEHVAAGVHDILGALHHRLPAFLGRIGEVLAGFLAALGRIEDRYGRADDRPGEKPPEGAAAFFPVVLL